MMGFLSVIGLSLRLIGLWFQLVGKSDKVKFQRYKEKGTEIKESGRLAKAVKFYEKALNTAETDDQQAEVWALLVYVHTDRAIGASQQYERKSGYIIQYQNDAGELVPWNFGPGNIPRNYKPPPRGELLK